MSKRTVKDMTTAETLEGVPSDALVQASEEEGPTGAVLAYRDASGIWRHVPECMAHHYRTHLKEDVRSVYVD